MENEELDFLIDGDIIDEKIAIILEEQNRIDDEFMMKLKCDDCDVPDVNHTMRFSYFEKIKEEYEANVIRFEISFILKFIL